MRRRRAVVGAGVNGRAVARTFVARGRDVLVWDVDAGGPSRPPRRSAGGSLEVRRGARRRPRRDGHAGARGRLRAGELASGTAREPDGRGRAGQVRDRGRGARARPDLLRRLGTGQPQRRPRARVEAGAISQDDATQLGDVLAGRRRPSVEDDITIFDSTGLAIQDLAIALAVMEREATSPCRRSTSRSAPESSRTSPCERSFRPRRRSRGRNRVPRCARPRPSCR